MQNWDYSDNELADLNDIHKPVNSNSSILFCNCGQGFSGANVEERLEKHIKSPDGIGSDLIKLMKG